MAKYKIKIGFGESEFIQREDGATIPKDEANSDYQEYLAWVDGGNTPDPEDTMSVEDEWINIREKRNELFRHLESPNLRRWHFIYLVGWYNVVH